MSGCGNEFVRENACTLAAAIWYEIIAENVYFTGEKPARQEKPDELPPEPPAPRSDTSPEPVAPVAEQMQFGDESDDYPF